MAASLTQRLVGETCPQGTLPVSLFGASRAALLGGEDDEGVADQLIELD
jgi:hypothetical protein